MLEPRYRRDYDGEFVILETRLVDGVKQERREWIPNLIRNDHTSGRAAVIGSRYDQDRFKHQRLANHKGGLLGSKRLQTYAAGDIWEDMRLDFYACTNRKRLDRILKTTYDETTVIYSNANMVIDHPNRLYPTPYSPYLADEAIAAYLACFDGHEEVFLIGFNRETAWDDKMVVPDMITVMEAYPGVKFISIGGPAGQPAGWLDLANLSVMPYRQFVTYCDI